MPWLAWLRNHRRAIVAPLLEVLGDADHRRPLVVGQLDDLQAQPAAAGARQLHRRPELGEEPRLAPLLEPLHDRLQDHEAHPRQTLEFLVAVDPPLQVHLAQPLEPAPIGDVDEVADLDGVAGEEGERLEQAPPAGVLARERLDQAGQLGEEEVDQRPRDQLGDPSAAALLEHAALDDRAAVVALDVLDPLLGDERPDRAVDHPRVPVADVRVGPGDDVAARLVQALPERLALAGEAAVASQDLLMDDDSGAFGRGRPREFRRTSRSR